MTRPKPKSELLRAPKSSVSRPPGNLVWAGDIDNVAHRIVVVGDGGLNVRREMHDRITVEWREVSDPMLLAGVLGIALLEVTKGWRPTERDDVVPGTGDDAHVVAEGEEPDSE